MKKPGRNDPCYCGSGKKYKQCHLKEDQAAEREQRAWKEAGRFVHRDLIKFARDERFAEAFAAALPYYWDGYYDIENADAMSMDEAIRFFDWFAFDYTPPEGQRLIEVYHQEKQSELSTYQQAVLDEWLESEPAGAFTLTGYDGQTLHLRDFLTGEEKDVHEASGHGSVEIGDVILARILPVRDQLGFSTTAAYLPANEIGNLAEKLEAAKASDAETDPDADHDEFMRRHNTVLIHHALAEAKAQGRPPVACLNPNRTDKTARSLISKMKRLRK